MRFPMLLSRTRFGCERLMGLARRNIPRSTRWMPAPSPARGATPALVPSILIVALVAFASASSATTWTVGHHVQTIQAGIDSAHAGDDVLIPPGTFPERDIRMKGGILLHSLQGPEASIVDARGVGRIFRCADFQEESVIKGLTLLNGRTSDPGGGVQCVRANLRSHG